ncbi:MAG: DUF3386 family protein [Armatimonadetes bacterium]|nr:DUF3386 family protein [Armatimonadota bacterium]
MKAKLNVLGLTHWRMPLSLYLALIPGLLLPTIQTAWALESRLAHEPWAASQSRRVLWGEGFPGFEAALEMKQDGRNYAANVTVSSSGKVEVSLADDQARNLAENTLSSVVDMYTGKDQPSTTVLESLLAIDGRLLPRTVVASLTSPSSSGSTQAATFTLDHVRVRGYELPRSVQAAVAGTEGTRIWTITLSNHRLLGNPPAAKKVGVLVMAHGGDEEWNRLVYDAMAPIAQRYTAAVSFEMGVAAGKVSEKVAELERQGVERIVAIPFFISDHSNHMDDLRYKLGLVAEHPAGEHAIHMAHHDMTRAQVNVPLHFASAMNDHPQVADILLRRAKALSSDPSRETVIIVGHGPNEDHYNEMWLAAMQRLADAVKTSGGFKAVVAATVRDDAPAEVQEAAKRHLRDLIKKASADGGKAVVVPLLISSGFVEQRIRQRLEGLDFAYSGEVLLPDPAVTRWLQMSVDSQLSHQHASR